MKKKITFLNVIILLLIPSLAFAEQIDWGNDPGPGVHPVDLGTDVTGNLNNIEHMDFDTAGSTSAEGRIYWDTADGTLAVGQAGGTVTNQVGQEVLVRVTNKSGADIPNGKLVYMSGAQGNRPTIELADNSDAEALYILGMTTEDINDNATGFITVTGLVRGDSVQPINTSGMVEGDRLYLDPVGNWTKTHPSTAGVGVIVIGTVLRVHVTDGIILMARPDSFTLGNNFDGIMRQSVINKSSGTSASSAFTVINDTNHRFSMVINSSNATLGPEITGLYNEGYGPTYFSVDGNQDFAWFTDPTDSHDYSSFTNEVMRLSAAGDLSVAGGVDVGGELTLGAINTFTPADTTPDVEGSSYWKTGGNIAITNFDGGSYTAGQIFVLEVNHSIEIVCSAGQFYCGNLSGGSLYYTTGDVLTWLYRNDGYWSIMAEALRDTEHSEAIVFIGAMIAEGNDIGVMRMPTLSRFPTMTQFSCVASGGSTADLDVFIEDCSANLTTCGAVGATVALSANDTLYEDTSFTDAVNSAGRWWKFNFGTVTVAPDILQCEISYASS